MWVDYTSMSRRSRLLWVVGTYGGISMAVTNCGLAMGAICQVASLDQFIFSFKISSVFKTKSTGDRKG